MQSLRVQRHLQPWAHRLPSLQLALCPGLRTCLALSLCSVLGIRSPLSRMLQILLSAYGMSPLTFKRPNSVPCSVKTSPSEPLGQDCSCPIPVPWSLVSLLLYAEWQLLVLFDWVVLEDRGGFILFVCPAAIRMLNREQLSGCLRSK